MCGIFAILGHVDLDVALALASRMSHRGPDTRGHFQAKDGSVLVHKRLSIIDLSCKQPIAGSRPGLYVVQNGEIYNHQRLKDELLGVKYPYTTACDGEAIVHLFEEYGYDFCNMLDGVFAFAVLDEANGGRFMAARDPIGVKPLYYGRDQEGRRYFASEMKAIADRCADVELKPFPPGHYYTPDTGFVRYFNPLWMDPLTCTKPLDYGALRSAFIASVEKRLMSDVPLGLLLSGGLDSSLVSSIAVRALKRTGWSVGNGGKIHSYSIGLDRDAPDIKAARKVAAFLDTDHHELYFTVEQGLKIIDRLVYHLESYDVTTIRASTPMYFLSKAIKEDGVTVVLSGEGADEIFGGYLYFHNAPSDLEFQEETISRVMRLAKADCLRADKSTMAHAIEVRVPFLDKSFLEVAMGTEPSCKRPSVKNGGVEKYILRKAFDDPAEPYLPSEILWRQKEQFSDGVGYNWIDQITAHCTAQVSDAEMATAAARFPYNTPATKEAYYMRSLFDKHFPGELAAKTVERWVPRWQLSQDPSGRASSAHVATYEKETKVEEEAGDTSTSSDAEVTSDLDTVGPTKVVLVA